MKIIIPAAGLGTRISSVSKERPKALTPVNGRPALHFILSEIQDTFEEFEIDIVIGYKGEQIVDFCKKYFSDMKINFVEQKELLGLAHAVSLCEVKKGPLLIWLGDTIIQKQGKRSLTAFLSKKNMTKKLNEISKRNKKSFLLTTYVKNSERWCCIENKNKKIQFIEKPNSSLGHTDALIGIYFFTNGKQIIDECKTLISDPSKKINNEFQLSSAMNMYQNNNQITSYDVEDIGVSYYDIGSIDNYHTTRKKLLDKRFVNNLFYQSSNSISKSSESLSLGHQIRWFLDAPPNIKKYCPAVYDYNLKSHKPSYEMEYFGFPTLQELFIWDELHPSVWRDIFNKISTYMEESKTCIREESYRQITSESKELFYDFIIDKTKKRIESSPHLKEVFGDIVNNGCWSGKIRDLFIEYSTNSFMHGDLCFSNILYDVNSGLLKVIDPRGYWEKSNGEVYVGGLGSDVYDLAKLMHSAVYDYDLIKNNISERNDLQNKIKDLYYESILSEYDDGNGYYANINVLVKSICFHLFVSMIPIHHDKPEHQKRMEAEALKIWIEICEHLI
jgi:dTDP-glucose pyrophosphorylase